MFVLIVCPTAVNLFKAIHLWFEIRIGLPIWTWLDSVAVTVITLLDTYCYSGLEMSAIHDSQGFKFGEGLLNIPNAIIKTQCPLAVANKIIPS